MKISYVIVLCFLILLFYLFNYNDKKAISNVGYVDPQNEETDFNSITENEINKVYNVDNNTIYENVSNDKNVFNFDCTLGIDMNDPSLEKFINPDISSKPSMDVKELQPKQKTDWFTDYSLDITATESNLLADAVARQGVNTIGSTKKYASHQLRENIPNPKFNVSIWNKSWVEPDLNLKGFSIC